MKLFTFYAKTFLIKYILCIKVSFENNITIETLFSKYFGIWNRKVVRGGFS